MQALDKVLTRVSTRRYDDDFVDRANYLYTPAMLAAFALTIAAKQYVGKPIQCWAPAQFKGHWEDYSENYCFVENTYYVSMDENFPREPAERTSRELHYYQWVPFMLAIQLLFFILPKALWNAFNWKTGMNVSALSKAAKCTTKGKGGKELKKADDETQANAVKNFAQVLNYNRKVQMQKPRQRLYGDDDSVHDSKDSATKSVNNTKSFVTVMYLIFKVFNLINCVVQLFILNKFLGPEYSMWGYGILVDLYSQRSWKRSGHFPRVTFCDVSVREQGGHIVRHTLQCVLMINMFNEKIFIFVWFWLVVLAAVNAINLVHWTVISFSPSSSKGFVYRHMKGADESMDDQVLNHFVNEVLGRDGITCLRLVGQNSGDMAVTNILEGLWKVNSQNPVPSLVTPKNFDFSPPPKATHFHNNINVNRKNSGNNSCGIALPPAPQHSPPLLPPGVVDETLRQRHGQFAVGTIPRKAPPPTPPPSAHRHQEQQLLAQQLTQQMFNPQMIGQQMQMNQPQHMNKQQFQQQQHLNQHQLNQQYQLNQQQQYEPQEAANTNDASQRFSPLPCNFSSMPTTEDLQKLVDGCGGGGSRPASVVAQLDAARLTQLLNQLPKQRKAEVLAQLQNDADGSGAAAAAAARGDGDALLMDITGPTKVSSQML